ncbi:MAG: TetR/AcrR family transcriptional regulator [Opitutaceae bacterium]
MPKPIAAKTKSAGARMSAAPGRRRPPDRERTCRRLLQTAIKLFARRGFHGVSVDEIAVAAHLSKRLPYYYYGSKGGLFRAALVEVYRRIEGMEFQVVDSSASPSEKLSALLEGYFVFLRENPEFTQLLLWGNLEKGRYFPSGVLTKAPLLRRFRQIVDEGVATGEFRKDLITPHLLINVIGLVFIYFSNRFSLSQVLDLDLGCTQEHQRALAQVKTVLLDGIRTVNSTSGRGGRRQRRRRRDPDTGGKREPVPPPDPAKAPRAFPPGRLPGCAVSMQSTENLFGECQTQM